MIVNLIGPPAAGKSTFAARFVVEHPDFVYCSIDECRIEMKDEVAAWDRFYQIIRENPNVVMESMGLSWRLKSLFHSPDIKSRMLVTIAMTGDLVDLHKRLDERQKRPVPFPYDGIDEHRSIDWAVEHLGKSEAKIDVIVDVSRKDIDETYEYLSAYLARKRLEELKHVVLAT